MFFDPKMQLVWVDGPAEKLDAFIEQCCVDGKRVHPARALDHMSGTTGFVQPAKENPWGALVEQIDQLASGFEIPIVEPTLADGRAPGTKDYLLELQQKLDALRADREILQKQLELCEKGTGEFSHFFGLTLPVDEAEKCEYIKLRFGRLPKRGYALLQKEYSDDPYILFVPCSEDEGNFWGVYFAPREKAARIDGVFAEAFFERVKLPGAAGTPDEVVKNLQSNMELLRQEIGAADAALQNAWNQEKWRVAGIYASVCSLARLFELRKCAAIRGGHFFYCVWLAQPELGVFQQLCAGVGGLNTATDQVLSLRRWKQENPGA